MILHSVNANLMVNKLNCVCCVSESYHKNYGDKKKKNGSKCLTGEGVTASTTHPIKIQCCSLNYSVLLYSGE